MRGRPPRFPFSRAAFAFFSDLIEPSATAAGFLGILHNQLVIGHTITRHTLKVVLQAERAFSAIIGTQTQGNWIATILLKLALVVARFNGVQATLEIGILQYYAPRHCCYLFHISSVYCYSYILYPTLSYARAAGDNVVTPSIAGGCVAEADLVRVL